MAAGAQFEPADSDPLRSASPEVDDVEARRARAAVASRLFSGPAKTVTVGRYRVETKIGAGGMGVVYRAHDPELDRPVALKLMNNSAFADEEEAGRARGRLVREARAMAKLAHPNVIHVYDVGAVDDGVFIAMELVDGDPLSTWIERETPNWSDVLRSYLDAGEGLAAAHEAGIVHRDFKPENVLIGTDGRVRVGDFGLAGGPGSETGRHEIPPDDDSGASIDLVTVSASLTRTGALLGTPKYMAPEQEAGLSATARSDQFGFCVALYEGLFGQAPFSGTTVAQYRHAVAAEDVREPDHAAVPRWVFDLIRRGLRRDPADRHPSMRALLDALRERLDGQAAPPPRWRKLLWMVVLGVGVGVAIGTGVAMRSADGDDVEVIAASQRPVPATPAATPVASPLPSPRHDPPLSQVAALVQQPQVDDDLPQSTSEDPPAPAPRPPETEPRPDTKPTRKRGSVCFYKEDKRSYLGARRRKADTFEHNGACYTCRKASSPIVATLSPPPGTSCRSSLLCTATRDDACAP